MNEKSAKTAELKSQLKEIKSYIDAKKSFVTDKVWNKKIGIEPDAFLTEKVNKAIVAFCKLGYMDNETFLSMKPFIKNAELLDFMEKSIQQ